MEQIAKVKVTYGSYQEEIEIFCHEDDEIEVIQAKAFKKLNCNFLPMAYKSAKILSREYV